MITENIFKDDQEDYNKFIKPVVEYSLKENITSFLCICLGIFFTQFIIFSKAASFSYTIFFMLLLLTGLFLCRKSIKITGVMSYFQLAIIIAYSLNLCIGTNLFIKSIDIVFLFIAFGFFMYNISAKKRFIETYCIIDIVKSTVVIPFSNIGKCICSIISVINKNKKSKNMKMIFIGLLLAVPLIIVVCPLLFAADSGMERFFENIFNNISDDYEAFFLKIILSFGLASIIFGVIYGNIKNSKDEEIDQNQSEQRKSELMDSAKNVPGTVLYSMVTPVCLLYVMFFFSQIKYFLSAFSGTLPESFSYAEYARKGFFELCVIVIINLLIITVINLLCKKEKDQKPKLLKIYTTIISVFTEILIATAISKMVMYIFNYGFTQLRVYTSWFMIMLAVAFVLIIINQFAKKFRLSSGIVMLFIISFSILSFGRIDANIAKWNIRLYQNNITDDLDLKLLDSLSDEAVPYISEFAEKNDELSHEAKEILENKAECLNTMEWTSFSISSLRAENILKEYK